MRGVFRSKGRPTRLFFAADLHGSQPTFRKFLGAAAFYETDALVFGGDLMGKALVPIVRSNGVFRAHFQGQDTSSRRTAWTRSRGASSYRASTGTSSSPMSTSR